VRWYRRNISAHNVNRCFLRLILTICFFSIVNEINSKLEINLFSGVSVNCTFKGTAWNTTSEVKTKYLKFKKTNYYKIR